MNNIASMIYHTIARHAEGGERITRVVLPDFLFKEYADDYQSVHLMKTLEVNITEGKVALPKFYVGETEVA